VEIQTTSRRESMAHVSKEHQRVPRSPTTFAWMSPHNLHPPKQNQSPQSKNTKGHQGQHYMLSRNT